MVSVINHLIIMNDELRKHQAEASRRVSKELAVVSNMLRKRGCTAQDGGLISTLSGGDYVFDSKSGNRVYIIIIFKIGDLKIFSSLAKDPLTEYILAISVQTNNNAAAIRKTERLFHRKIEVWVRSELAFDISEHSLQPTSVQEYTDDMCGVPKRSLPVILSVDPLSRYYRLRPDSVVLMISPLDGFPNLFYVK